MCNIIKYFIRKGWLVANIKSKKVYIWGTGKIAKQYIQCNEISQESVIGFIETEKSKDYFWNKPVFTPNEILDKNYDYIIVCVYNYGNEIFDLCRKIGLDTNKIILLRNWMWSDGESISGNKPPMKCCKKVNENQIDVQNIFPVLYKKYIEENDILAKQFIVASRNGYDLLDNNIMIMKEGFLDFDYQKDYFRFRTFELVANEILNNNIDGDVAELGVFRGAFSKMINCKFPKKTLYMFDTFESFDKEEFEKEVSLKRVPDSFYETFKQTDENYVLSIMPYPDKCKICKGFFPDTTRDLKETKFAFVSIDVDFEQSIYEGLKFFYPRLTDGGMIFVHDYNNRYLEGVKVAVHRYENEIGIKLKKVPLADEGGTVILVK